MFHRWILHICQHFCVNTFKALSSVGLENITGRISFCRDLIEALLAINLELVIQDEVLRCVSFILEEASRVL